MNTASNIGDYNVVFIGYPIWWGQAPRIISTFLENYDFSGKTLVPFCTSGSSPIGSSAEDLNALTSDTTKWLKGERFAGSVTRKEIEDWIAGLDLPKPSTGTPGTETPETGTPGTEKPGTGTPETDTPDAGTPQANNNSGSGGGCTEGFAAFVLLLAIPIATRIRKSIKKY